MPIARTLRAGGRRPAQRRRRGHPALVHWLQAPRQPWLDAGAIAGHGCRQLAAALLQLSCFGSTHSAHASRLLALLHHLCGELGQHQADVGRGVAAGWVGERNGQSGRGEGCSSTRKGSAALEQASARSAAVQGQVAYC